MAGYKGRGLKLQVTLDHYKPEQYEELHRWISYWYQIQSIIRSGAKSVLEIGLGTGIVTHYLRHRLGLKVTTLDFDESLNPDIVGDVRELASLVGGRQFDAVAAFQVLEHLPFEDFVPVLKQMARVSRKVVLISLPYNGTFFQVRLKVWRLSVAFGRKIPRYCKWRFDGEHYWEIGTRGHSLTRIRSAIKAVLDIEWEYFCPDYPYHYFFECRVRHEHK